MNAIQDKTGLVYVPIVDDGKQAFCFVCRKFDSKNRLYFNEENDIYCHSTCLQDPVEVTPDGELKQVLEEVYYLDDNIKVTNRRVTIGGKSIKLMDVLPSSIQDCDESSKHKYQLQLIVPLRVGSTQSSPYFVYADEANILQDVINAIYSAQASISDSYKPVADEGKPGCTIGNFFIVLGIAGVMLLAKGLAGPVAGFLADSTGGSLCSIIVFTVIVGIVFAYIVNQVIPSSKKEVANTPSYTPVSPIKMPQVEPPIESKILAEGVWRCPDKSNDAVLVGSDDRKKFHHPSCRWAQKIKDENRIGFSSRDTAIDYGYVECGTCKGLSVAKAVDSSQE